MAKCVHGYDSQYCGNVHGAWRHDEPSLAVVQDYTETYDDGVSPEAKSYFQKKLKDFGYAKHPAPEPEPFLKLEDYGFAFCKNCSTMSVLGEYGLCKYCEELSDLNRSQAVSDGHKAEYLKARHDITINRRIFYGMLSIWLVLTGLITLAGSGELTITAVGIGAVCWALATPGYIKSTNIYKRKCRELVEAHPELQVLAARATTGSTGPR